jgi:hypothetical protein
MVKTAREALDEMDLVVFVAEPNSVRRTDLLSNLLRTPVNL